MRQYVNGDLSKDRTMDINVNETSVYFVTLNIVSVVPRKSNRQKASNSHLDRFETWSTKAVNESGTVKITTTCITIFVY